MKLRPLSTIAALAIVGTLAGCASLDSPLTTSSVQPASETAAATRVDPACVTLTSQIDQLRKEGVADKIEKAAAKKYKMTPADLAKANELNRANAEFQTRCSTITPRPAQQAAAAAPTAGTQVAQSAQGQAPSTAQKAAAGAATKATSAAAAPAAKAAPKTQ